MGQYAQEVRPELAQHKTVLAEAEAIVYNGARQQDYGHPKEHFARTVGMLNAAFTKKITIRLQGGLPPFEIEDWPVIMILDKVARLMNNHKRDTVRDIAGYAATLERVVGGDE